MHHFAEVEHAIETVPGLIEPGDLVVVKGSRSLRLERVVEALSDEFGVAD